MKEQNNDWKNKAKKIFESVKKEVVKATEIGKKMVSASQKSTELKDFYEALGSKAYQGIKSKGLDWEDAEVQNIVHEIDQVKKDIKVMEKQVRKIKSKKQA